MKRLLVLTLLLLSASLAQISEPKLVERVEADYLEETRIMVLNGEWYELVLNLSMPQNRDYQTSSFQGTTLEDSEGNTILRERDENPSNPYIFSVDAEVITSKRRTTSLPESYTISKDLMPYLEETNKAQSESSIIKQKAEEITNGASSDFEKIALLAIWVSENIEYDLNEIGKDKDALTVLQTRTGVCIEHSNLFTAFTRSIGYPTRYILGKAYGSYGWLGHSWNEVYLGKWVPVDPTWLEVGSLDATHIEFHRSKRGQLLNEVRANATPSATIEWPKETNFFGSTGNESGIILTHSEEKSPSDDYSLIATSEEIGLGEENIVYLEIQGKEYDVIKVNMVSCSHDTWIIDIENPVQYAITEPGKKTIVSWKISSNPSLERGVVFTCPLTLNSRTLKEGVVSIKVMEDHESPELNMNIQKPVITVGSEQKVTVFVEGQAEKIGLIGDGFKQEKTLSGTEQSFSFTPETPGEKTLIAYSSEGGFAEESFTVKESLATSIQEISVPTTIMTGQSFDVNITLKNNEESRNVKLETSFAGQRFSEKTELVDTQTFSFRFNATNSGKGLLKASITEGGSDEENIVIDVKEKARVDIHSIKFIEREGKLLTQVSFTKSSTVMGLQATVSGQSLTEGKLDLDPGNHTMVFTWEDPLGNKYVEEREVVVPQHGRQQIQGLEIDDTMLALFAVLIACVIFAFVLVLVAIALHSRS